MANNPEKHLLHLKFIMYINIGNHLSRTEKYATSFLTSTNSFVMVVPNIPNAATNFPLISNTCTWQLNQIRGYN